jgi:hypothetical protein
VANMLQLVQVPEAEGGNEAVIALATRQEMGGRLGLIGII